MKILNQSEIHIAGVVVMLLGLGLALLLGGVEGFTLGPIAGMAYIGGFVLAFIGAYFAFVYGRVRKRSDEI